MPALDRVVTGSVALLTVAFGSVRAGDRGFWFDEAFTAVAADQPLGDLVRQLRHEAGMGPYYLTLWAWNLLGSSEWWLRLWSVTGGGIAVGALYLLAVRCADRAVALVAVVALVCNPSFLRNLTELRAYSWTMGVAVISTLLFLRFVDAPDRRRAIGYGASVGLLLSLLAFAAGVVIAHVAFGWVLLRDRRHRALLALAGMTGAVLLAPSLPALLTSEQLSWIPATTARLVYEEGTKAVGGEHWAAFLAAGNLLLVASWRRRPSTDAELGLRLAVAVCVAMPVALLALSLIDPYWRGRYLSPVVPFAVLGAAAGAIRAADAFARRSRRPVVAAAAVALCVVGFPGAPATDLPRPEDLRKPAANLEEAVLPSDAVVFEPAYVADTFSYYWPSPRAEVIRLEGVDPAQIRATLDPFCRVWHVSRQGVRGKLRAIMTILPGADVSRVSYPRYVITKVDACAR